MSRDLQAALDSAVARSRSVLDQGVVASYIPELAKADASHLGGCIMTGDGHVYESGDCNVRFTMQSVSKVASLILALQTTGFEAVFSKVGMEPTGDRFDSVLQLELKDWRPFNPMINAGAIITADCIHAADPFAGFLELVRALCGDPDIRLNEKTYLSEKATGTRNRSIAYLLKAEGILRGEPEEVLDVYFRACSVTVTARDLARFALVLSLGGVDPDTGRRLVDGKIVRAVKTLMMLCGMYDESGDYAVRVGMPSKSGVGGGIMAVGPVGVGIGTFGPALNKKGNSVGGKMILQSLSEELCWHTFDNP